MPGYLAERLDANLASKLSGNFENVILVTGTNGKTTTTKMLANILGDEIVTNRSGSNLKRGIVTSLIEYSSITGRMHSKTALFEVDEASMKAVAEQVKPTIILVLNLFRDQLDRYGELNRTAELIGQAIKISPQSNVLLNADDPLVASLGSWSDAPEKITYFGIEDSASKRLPADHTADSDHCPVCGGVLIFSKNYFGHMGHYICEKGDFGRPKTSFMAIEKSANESGTEVYLESDGRKYALQLPLPGLYNMYNAVAAAAAARALGFKLDKIVEILATSTAAFGRVERVAIGQKHIILLLIKNPTGFNQVIQTFLVRKKAPVMMAINDNFADGRDISWLWDAGVEDIFPEGQIIVSGVRRLDMALRLKYAEKEFSVQEEIEAGVDELLSRIPEGGVGYVLPTYTAMLSIREVLRKKGAVKEFWK